MARSMLDALLKQPRRMGARTASRNTLGINHPLAESSPVSRIPISMMPGGGPASGYTQEDLATLALPKETTLFSPLGYDITDKDLAKFGLATDALDLVPGAAVLGGLATGARLLGRALKGADYAPASMDDLGAALLGQRLQRQGLFDDAMVTYHGSPYKFDKFDMGKLGTGSGAQSYGHGMYVAQNPLVANQYQIDTGRKTPVRDTDESFDVASYSGDGDINDHAMDRATQVNMRGSTYEYVFDDDSILQIDIDGNIQPFGKSEAHLYKVDVPDEAIAKMLDWNAPFSEQPEAVQDALLSSDSSNPTWARELDFYKKHQSVVVKETNDGWQLMRGDEKLGVAYNRKQDAVHSRNFVNFDVTGFNIYDDIVNAFGSREAASAFLQKNGIPGIKYWDGDSRSAGEGTRNFVVFDDKLPTILERDGEKIAQPSVDEFIGKLLED